MMTSSKENSFYMTEREERAVMPAHEIQNTCPFGPGLQKYWDLLSPEERTMQMDVAGLYSLTVRELAFQIATTLKGDTVFDAFCGVGGNAIAFALAGKYVTACEIDPVRLEMAKANARAAGVADRINFILGDATTLLGQVQSEAVFLDPPWGGPQYSKLDKFKLTFFAPDGGPILDSALHNYQAVAFKLPGNFDFDELNRYDRDRWQVQENCLHGKLLHFSAYHQ